ncbi:hypothetical protein D3C71_1740260 [compost metagenome]
MVLAYPVGGQVVEGEPAQKFRVHIPELGAIGHAGVEHLIPVQRLVAHNLFHVPGVFEGLPAEEADNKLADPAEALH